jgi:cytochrome c biogenesis protein CcmG/thiol:disulfide interchange protein DsbE
VSDTVTDPAVEPDDGDRDGSGRRRVAPFIVLAVAVLVGALFVVLAGSDPASDDTIDSSLIGQPAPGATGDLLGGGTFDLSRRKGSWVVLNFFDPACVPCVEEHPELVALEAQQTSLSDGAELYTVINRSVSPGGGTDDDVQAFFDDRGGQWPVVRDPDGGISVAFGVSQVPETWIVDPDGVVRVRFAGPITAEGVGTVLQQMREQRNG